MSARSLKRGFTLVELLVVIGIIVLLISILLPSLGRAGAQANLIYCQSNLRQIGIVVSVYGVNNKGVAPWGNVNFNTYPSWVDTITLLVQPSLASPNKDWCATKAAAIFNDKDTIPSPQPWGYDNHYTGNFRIFPQPNVKDGGGVYYQQHKLYVKNADRVMIVWDGLQNMVSWASGTAAVQSWTLDRWQYNWGHSYLGPTPAGPYQSHGTTSRSRSTAAGTTRWPGLRPRTSIRPPPTARRCGSGTCRTPRGTSSSPTGTSRAAGSARCWSATSA